jgi:hypothetical protein
MDIERLLRIGIHWRLPNDYRACIRAINSGRMLDSTGSKHLYRALNALAIDLAGLPVDERRPGLMDLFLKVSSIRRSTIA